MSFKASKTKAIVIAAIAAGTGCALSPAQLRTSRSAC